MSLLQQIPGGDGGYHQDMLGSMAGGRAVWILGFGTMGLVAWGLGQWREIATTQRLNRLHAEPGYLRQALAEPGSGVTREALARYLREAGGRQALLRLALSEAPGEEDNIQRALATGLSGFAFFSLGCVRGSPRSMDDGTGREMLRWLARLEENEFRLPEYPLLRFKFWLSDPENLEGLCSIENLGEPTGVGEADDEGGGDEDFEKLLKEVANESSSGPEG